jgi:uncharacterized protein YgiM (DUF1202 family)
MLKKSALLTGKTLMLLIIVASIFICMGIVFASQSVKIRYVSEDNVNLRCKPSLSSDVVRVLNKGEKLYVKSYKNGWLSIKMSNGINGWVHEKFITSQKPTPSIKVSSRGDFSTMKVRYINSENVNLRQSPSLSSSVVSVLSRGEKIFVQSYDNSGWVEIYLESGKKGWVHEKFISTSPGNGEECKVRYVIGHQINVRNSPSLSSKVITTANQGDKVTVLAYKNEGWVKVSFSDGRTGWIHEKFIGKEPTQRPGMKIRYILGTHVNLRDKPSTNASIVGSVSSGEKVLIEAYDDSGWAYIELSNGTNAWISVEFITSSPVYPGMKVRYVCGNGVNVRSKASLNASVVTIANAGDKAFIKTYDNTGWVSVVLEGARKGWINEKYLTDSRNAQNTVTSSKIRYIQGNGVNVRKGPSLNEKVITTVNNGVEVRAESYDDDGWVLISTNKYKGWVYKGYVGVDILPEEMVVMSSSPNKAPVSSRGNSIVDRAYSYMGIPYVWGGTTAYGFDCSGFAQRVYSDNGISILRTADAQFTEGISVGRNELKPGDMVFFTTYTYGASHVGIYIGNSEFIHASSGAGEVTINSLNDYYYNERFLGGRRIQ